MISLGSSAIPSLYLFNEHTAMKSSFWKFKQTTGKFTGVILKFNSTVMDCLLCAKAFTGYHRGENSLPYRGLRSNWKRKKTILQVTMTHIGVWIMVAPSIYCPSKAGR